MRLFLFFLFMLTPAFIPITTKAETAAVLPEICKTLECLMRHEAEAKGVSLEGCETVNCMRKALVQNADRLQDINVERVIDGDTFIADKVKVQIWGIEAPEADEPMGALATRRLKELLFADSAIKCRHKVIGGRGTTNMQCFSGGLDVGETMIREGLAKKELRLRKVYSCPYDARECPDGSVVGRQGPDCEFFKPCPGDPSTKRRRR